MKKMAKVMYKMPRPNDEECSPNEASEAKNSALEGCARRAPWLFAEQVGRAGLVRRAGWPSRGSGATSKSLLCFARRATSLLAEQTLFPGFILLKLALSFEGI